MTENAQVAFALGGLAGNNAYGAGFLQAASHCTVKPALITCTSGQIYWVAEYLSCLRDKKTLSGYSSLSEALRQHLSEQTPYGLLVEEMKEHLSAKLPLPPAMAASLAMAVESACSALPMPRDAVFSWLFWHGKDKRYAPVWLDYTRELLTNSVGVALELAPLALSGRLDQVFLTDKWLSIWPSRSMQPRFPPEFFVRIAELMNESDIGIAFNSYDAKAGLEHIYMNQRGLDLLEHFPGQRSRYRHNTIFAAITPQAVQAALWLYHYGFPGNTSLLDGAYYRSVMLSEACAPSIARIYAVRPVPGQWQGPLPQRFVDGKDFETEIAFNGTFAGEYDKMQLIRNIANDVRTIAAAVNVGQLPQPVANFVNDFIVKYPPIDVVPVELKLPRGFFDFLFEGGEVFDAGFEDACEAFRGHLDCGKGRKLSNTPCALPAGQPLKKVA